MRQNLYVVAVFTTLLLGGAAIASDQLEPTCATCQQDGPALTSCEAPTCETGCETQVCETQVCETQVCETACRCELKKVCVAHRAKVKAEKDCFDCKCKEICVPGIKWPWSCHPTKGKVKTVRYLTKRTAEYEKCGYEHEIQTECQPKKGHFCQKR
ncbi:hypothetical protein Pan216_31460 [Planctomycetes bacterium Pan216]|uniref:4Fe-4S ferredoxin-type domain-containing protein n=1 Tax=Kolteria novifilia TaxID=2527975 RepID=A0A518B5N0_9BACT|nr:hypothetical protein Pan216_31460 [Planctomycetes bacterium Pan216]